MIVSIVLLAIKDKIIPANNLISVLNSFSCQSEIVENYPNFPDNFRKITARFRGTDHELSFTALIEEIVTLASEYPDSDIISALYAAVDAKTGIVFTPTWVGEILCLAADIQDGDHVFDPTCGSGGLLRAASSYAHEKNFSYVTLSGTESQEFLANLSAVNIASCEYSRGDIAHQDFFTVDNLNEVTVGLINPPYSLGSSSKPHLYELGFILRLLDLLPVGAKVAALIPNRSLTGVQVQEKKLKTQILSRHTVDGVISLPQNIFMPHADINASIIVFTAHISHDLAQEVLFIDFTDSGFIYGARCSFHRGESADSRLELLADTWKNRKSVTDFSLLTPITDSSEWLYNYFYRPTKPPSEQVFFDTVAEYLKFQVNMTLQDRGYLFVDDSYQQVLG